jgi:hypothetical protein
VTRNWLSFRLLKSLSMDHDDHAALALPAVVRELVDQLRSADVDGRWFFQRLDGHPGPSLGLWFRSTTAVLHELEQKLRAESMKRDWPLTADHYEPQRAKYASRRGVELATRLAAASSDFALDLLDGGEPLPDAQLPLAVLHLEHLVELVPERDRRSFLFLCWQHWTAGMRPGQRIELGIHADCEAETVHRAVADIRMREHLDDSWQRYLRMIRGVTASRRPTDAPPMNYLLFDHAHLTHNRLGIPVAVEAQAARVLRAALGRGDAAPDPATSVTRSVRSPALQSA